MVDMIILAARYGYDWEWNGMLECQLLCWREEVCDGRDLTRASSIATTMAMGRLNVREVRLWR